MVSASEKARRQIRVGKLSAAGYTAVARTELGVRLEAIAELRRAVAS